MPVLNGERTAIDLRASQTWKRALLNNPSRRPRENSASCRRQVLHSGHAPRNACATALSGSQQLNRGSTGVERPDGRSKLRRNRVTGRLFDSPGLNGQGGRKRDLLGLTLIQADQAVFVVMRPRVVTPLIITRDRLRMVVVTAMMPVTMCATVIDEMRCRAAFVINDRMLKQMQSLTAQRCDQIGGSA